MLVATFGPTTGWAGRTITFYDGRFTLEGHGFVTAHDVLEYDRQGHLAWAYDGLREWAYSLAPPPPPARPPSRARRRPSRPAGSASRRQAERAGRTPAAGRRPPSAREPAAAPAGASGGRRRQAADPRRTRPAATIVQDLWRAQCLDFDARVLAALGAAGDPGRRRPRPGGALHLLGLPGRGAGRDRRRAVHAVRPRRRRRSTPCGPDPTRPCRRAERRRPRRRPPGWTRLDAPWAAMAVPPGWVGGAPETAAVRPRPAALQARGPDWAAWAGEWLTPADRRMYANSGGQLAALLFAADAGAASLDDAAYAVLAPPGARRARTAASRCSGAPTTSRAAWAQTGLIESVAYGTLAGRPASRIVAETPGRLSARAPWHPHRPVRLHASAVRVLARLHRPVRGAAAPGRGRPLRRHLRVQGLSGGGRAADRGRRATAEATEAAAPAR